MIFTVNRISPYVLASAGRGVSRPNVNDVFPDRVTNDATLLFFGGGVRIAVTEQLSAFADMRFGIQAERDSIIGLTPVRGGVTGCSPDCARRKNCNIPPPRHYVGLTKSVAIRADDIAELRGAVIALDVPMALISNAAAAVAPALQAVVCPGSSAWGEA